MREIAICVPVGRSPSYQFWRSLRQLNGATNVLDVRGAPVEKARQQLTVEALLKPEVTHLLFIDDDMQFPPDALERLLAHDVPIVGGLCHARRPPWNPMLARREPNGLYSFQYDYPLGGLVEVDATGAAFLLVERQVFEAMDAPDWWKPSPPLTEDFSFCVRAKAVGYPVLVDVGLDIGHVAEVVVDRRSAAGLRGEGAKPMPPPSGWRAKAGAFLHGAPRASIIIPTYNQRPALLQAAIASALTQSVPVEVIVVDDGSDTPLAVPAGVQVIRHEQNLGIATALNRGINAMTTEWFCWLSSDDTIAPTKVETQLGELLTTGAKCGFHDYDVPASGLVGTRLPPTWRTLQEQHTELTRNCVINGSTVMIHRGVFKDVGLFDPTYLYGQDWEFWCRVGEKYLWHPTTQVLGSRNEGGNLTETIAAEAPDSIRRARRDAEDAMIRTKYTVKHCKHCGGQL